MTLLPARWRRALLLYAWRLLERWRIRLVRCQAWLERRFGGWGEEIGFVSDADRWSEDRTTDVPAHWAALVRRGAPWLLRRPAPPGGTAPVRQPGPRAGLPKTGVGSVPSTIDGAKSVSASESASTPTPTPAPASVSADDAAMSSPESQGVSRVFRAEAGRVMPRRFHTPPPVAAAGPLPDIADSAAGSAGPAAAMPGPEHGAMPGGRRPVVADFAQESIVSLAVPERDGLSGAAQGARRETAQTSLAGIVVPRTDYAVAEPGSSTARPAAGLHEVGAEAGRQPQVDILASPASRTVAPSWPALPGEAEENGVDRWPDLPGSDGAPAAGEDIDAWGESREQRWSA